MTSRQPERNVRPTVLDRLTDLAPKATADPTISLSESARQYKAGLRRDLEWLLNTRRITDVYEARDPYPPETYTELNSSVFTYGLQDTTSRSADNPVVRSTIKRQIEECVRLFEPRLTSVEVTLLPPADDKRKVQFVIKAILRMEPDSERVLFDTTLDSSRGMFVVEGGTE